MTGTLLPNQDGRTRLSEEDLESLIPGEIETREDLFAAEHRNISDALLRRPPSSEELLDDKYLRDLHQAMFGDVWRWAGEYRKLGTNIGVAPAQISTCVLQLVGDTKARIDHRTFAPDEIAVRFHHRLVEIHPFRDGNGRHGRIAADYLVEALGSPYFSWGRRLDVDTQTLRGQYIAALRRADRGGFDRLVEFARS